jgi:pilus assembly protein CpaC
MRPGTPIRAAALAALAAVLAPGLFAALPHRIAAAAELALDPQTQTIVVAASDFGSRSVALGVGKSVVIDFPRDIKDVLVANPRIANAVIRSSRRAYVIGNEIGQTNVFFFDAEGKQLAGLDIAVTRNLNGIRAAIKQVVPDSDVRVEGIGVDGVILSGFVSSQAEAQQAFDIATRLLNTGSIEAVGSGTKVVNAIVVRNRDQIMLKVTVAEVERDLIKQLGINLSGSFGFGSTVVNFNNNNPFTALGQSLSGSFISPTSNRSPARCRPWSRPASFIRLRNPISPLFPARRRRFWPAANFRS